MKLPNAIPHIQTLYNEIDALNYYSRNDEKFKATCLKNRLKRKNKKK